MAELTEDEGRGKAKAEGKAKPPQVAVQLLEGDRPMIVISGEIDISTVSQVEMPLRQALEGQPVAIVFDLSGVVFMDSSALAVLVSAAQRVPEVRIRNPSLPARRVIELTGLTSLLRVESDT